MAHSEHRSLRRRGRSWLGRFLTWSAGAILVLAVAIVIATPWILRAVVPEIFARFGVQASVTGGSLSPLRGEVVLAGLRLGAPDAPALSLGELGIALKLRALLDGRIELRHLRVRNVSLNEERLLALRKLDESISGPGQQSLPVEFGGLELEDIHLSSITERIGHDVRIARLSISDLDALLADKKSKVFMQGNIGDGSVELQLEVALEKQDVRAGGKIRLDRVPLRGWAGLASRGSDPLASGFVGGHGDINVGYAYDTRKVDMALVGQLGVTGLGVGVAPLEAERVDADWQGRLALGWAPDLSTPTMHGDGKLEVATLHALISESPQAPVRAALSDVSWQGDFDWQGEFTSDGAMRGARVDVSDASRAVPGWRVRAEDFSSRLHAAVADGSGELDARVQGFDLAHLSIVVTDAELAFDVAVEKLAMDEVATAQSGDLVLGLATADTLTVTENGGADSADRMKLRVDAPAAKGVSGGLAGKLRAANITAESFDYAGSGKELRAEGIDFAGVALGAAASADVQELNVKSLRADAGEGDIWLSGLKATKAHGDAGGRFGAESVAVTHSFQVDSNKLSWDAADLAVRGLEGDSNDALRVSAIDLAKLKIGIDEALWESLRLHTADVVVTMSGDVQAASLGFATLARRQPGVGNLHITDLDARGFRLRDGRAVLDGVKATKLGYDFGQAETFEAHMLEARELAGDLEKGLEARRFSVAAGAGQFSGGARVNATALEVRGLGVTKTGDTTLGQAELRGVKYTGSDSTTLDLENLSVSGSRWEPGGRMSAAVAALHVARIAGPEDVAWQLEQLDASKLAWDGDARIRAELATLAAANQTHGERRDWRAQTLRVTDFFLTLPDDVKITSLAAQAVDGGDGSPAWEVKDLSAEALSSSAEDSHKVERLKTGAVTVTNARNSALLNLERAEVAAARLGEFGDLSAAQLLVEGLQLRSGKPDWPAQLTVVELQITKPLLPGDGGLDLESVVARNPSLTVAETPDNDWMWPPLPGAGSGAQRTANNGGGAKGARETGSTEGIRVARFVTRGPARITYIDRGTVPAMRVTLDPVVLAIENLDTRLPGSVSHFRARGTGEKFDNLDLKGELITRAGGVDLGLKLRVQGVYLPELNPYVAKQEALSVTAGRGDADNDIKIENDVLEGTAQVLLAGLQVKSTWGGSTLTQIDPFNFPISTAVALLKDRQGNISLTIPLRERTDAPAFDAVDEFQDAFIRTITTASQMAASLPGKTLDSAMDLLQGTISLLPGVGAESYAPIGFAAGADHLSAEPLVYLDQLGVRMRRYEALVLAPCGRSIAGEEALISGQISSIDTLFAEASNGVYGVYQPGREGLLALAEARADMVRRYLHTVHGIPEQRLSSCAALIDDGAGAKPRVELQVKTPAGNRGLFGIFR